MLSPNRRSFPQQDAHRYGLKPKMSKTSLPSPPENGTMTPINDDGLVFYYCNKKPWPGYYRRKGLFGLIVLIRVHYRHGKEAGRHGGWSRSC